MASNRGEIDRRVVRAAEAALAKRKFVTAICTVSEFAIQRPISSHQS